jgi:predicted component of type VI protein secretion system
MSLEQALADNTAALHAHTAALLGKSTETISDKLDRVEKTVAPKATTKAATKKEEPKAAEGPDYEAVKKSFLALCTAKGKDAGLAVLKPFGVAKCPELKPEQFAEFITASDAAASAEESLV